MPASGGRLETGRFPGGGRPVSVRRVPADGELFLDHVAHFVPDLDAAARALRSAGFVLTPPTRQRNRNATGLVPSGTANCCAMLREGYLEFLAATDDTPLARQLVAALERRTGLHLVAFATDDADTAHAALARGGFDPYEPVHLTRPVESADGAVEEARFTVLRVPPEAMPEGRIQLLRHHTPELLWQQDRLDHDNGIVSLAGTLLCVDDPEEAAARFARFTSRRFERRDDRRIVALDRGALAFVAPEALGRVAPFAATGVDERGAATPWIVATALGSDDPALTRERLVSAGFEALGTDEGAAGPTSYRFPPSVGGFASVVPAGAAPEWLA